MKTRTAFTIVELLVGIVIMAITLGVATMSINSARQTAKREAERLQSYIYRQMEKADRMHNDFILIIGREYIYTQWGSYTDLDTSYKATAGCHYSDNYGTKDCRYKYNKKMFNAGHIDVYGADGDKWYVIFAGINEGRVRISDTPPK